MHKRASTGQVSGHEGAPLSPFEQELATLLRDIAAFAHGDDHGATAEEVEATALIDRIDIFVDSIDHENKPGLVSALYQFAALISDIDFLGIIDALERYHLQSRLA